MKMRSIAAGKFKAKCLKLMNEVSRTRRRLIITKRNVPIVELVPLEKKQPSLFGCMKGSVQFIGDITKPIGEEWDADR
jgi:prevent-host-death family protein